MSITVGGHAAGLIRASRECLALGHCGPCPQPLRRLYSRVSPENYVKELDTPENRKFRDVYKKKFGEEPEEFAVVGYDAVRFIIEAVKARGGDTKDRPALIGAIEKVAYTGPRGPMKMAKNHQATQNVYIVKTVKKDNAVAFDIIDTFTNFEDPVEGCRLD